jgi:hypothetical protein
MHALTRPTSLVPPAGLLLLAGLTLVATGCRDRRATHVREDRVAHAVALAPQSALRIETRTADVHLVPSPDDTIRVLTVKRVQSMSQRSIDALWKEIRVTVERAGDELILRVREPERGTTRVTVEAGPWRIRRHVEIEVTIAVPPGRAITLVTERGDIDAHDLRQPLTLDLYGGDAHLYDLDGGELRVTATSGDVTIQRVRQPISVRTTSGDVEAEDLTGPVAIRATSGDVSVSRLAGRVAIETSTGDVDADGVNGNALISTSSGDATLRVEGDSVLVETSSGDQDIDVVGAPKLVSLRSASGGIEVMLPRSTGGALDVQTASGAMSVASAIKVGTMTRNHLTGDLGGAGRTQVRSSSGDIHVSAREGIVAVEEKK